jgi:hypothetical protein
MKKELTINALIQEARAFCEAESKINNSFLYGVTDGKAVGTHIEAKFKQHLFQLYNTEKGNAASGIDLPSENILTDIKVTSIKQPQSSCPFKDAKQKIFGLGYNLLVFVYDKKDDPINKTAILDFVSCNFIEKERTGDYQTTFYLNQIIDSDGNLDDIFAYLNDVYISFDEQILWQLAKKILENPPLQGYISNLFVLEKQNYLRKIIELDKEVEGIIPILNRKRA